MSPPCTIGSEPEKLRFAYRIQHFLSRFAISVKVLAASQVIFYNKHNHLRIIFRLLTRKFARLDKVSIPENENLIEVLKEFCTLRTWLWINPNKRESLEDRHLIENEKVFGIKFHMFWHRLSIEDVVRGLRQVEEIDKPVYIILGFDHLSAVKRQINHLRKYRVILGYGGFPNYQVADWILENHPNAYIDTSSGHIGNWRLRQIYAKYNDQVVLGTDFPYIYKGKSVTSDFGAIEQRIKYFQAIGFKLSDLNCRFQEKSENGKSP